MNRFSILLVSLFLITPNRSLSSQGISRLDAVHITEIHTGGTVQSISLTNEGEQQFYLLEALIEGNKLRVHINSKHGRLISIERRDNDSWVSQYRWPGVRVVAHRGGALLGPPENTLPAIEKAIQIGADLIEIDIRQTKDGALVLMHDTTVDRTTDGSGPISQMTLSEVRRLRVSDSNGRDIRVPTLEEALKTMKGRIDADLDYKDGNLEKLITIVRGLGMVKNSTMYGSWERAAQIAQLEPGLRIRPTADFPLQVPRLARELRPAIINLDWHAVSDEAIKQAHLHGCHAFVNCLAGADVDQYIRWAVDAGADYIQSDRPDVVIEILKEKNLYRLGATKGDPLGTPLQTKKLGYPFR
jgi:glycerophosphoryl diester phosphodiesterase